MADAKQVSYRAGDVFFYAAGHVRFQGDCARGEPPKGTTRWCVVGQAARGWMAIEAFDPATRGAKVTETEGASHG